jgi:hypothetical protein
LLLSPQDLLLMFLQGGGDIPLAIHKRLLPYVVGRNQMNVRLGDLEVVTEDPIVSDLQVRDLGLALFRGRQFRDPGLAVARQDKQFIEPLVVTFPNKASLLQG